MPTVEENDNRLSAITEEDFLFFDRPDVGIDEFCRIFSPPCGYLYSDDLENIRDNLAKANLTITEHCDKFTTSCCESTILTDIRIACIILGWIEYNLGCNSSPLKQLDNIIIKYKKGVVLTKILPFVFSYHKCINKSIDAVLLARTIERNRVPVSDDEIPF